MVYVEKMFFQVRVKREDQSFLRFLWWPNGDLEQKAKEYCMTMHLFSAESSPACACESLKVPRSFKAHGIWKGCVGATPLYVCSFNVWAWIVLIFDEICSYSRKMNIVSFVMGKAHVTLRKTVSQG